MAISTSANIFEPLRVGPVNFRNRVAFGACVNNLGTNLKITDAQIAFYKARSVGGVAAVITEGLSVHPTSVPNASVPLAYLGELVHGLGQMANAIHQGGALAIGQLWHVGRNALWGPASSAWAPSAIPDPYSGTFPHAMSDSEIASVIDGFVKSARNLAEAGFDGVEIHGAHGYLVGQFLSPWSNTRPDAWGGSTKKRVKFLREIVNGIRTSITRPFAIGVKLSVDEYVEGGLTLEESIAVIEELGEDYLPDYIAVSQGNFSPSLERHVPDNRLPLLIGGELARAIRKSTPASVAIMCLGHIPNLEYGETLISDGASNLIGLVRPLLADPEVVRKSLTGEAIRPCIFCNSCWNEIHTNRIVTCPYAPNTGRESQSLDSERTTQKRRTVQIIGAGPAGLEAARVAALSGHKVTLYEANAQPGGRLYEQSGIPGRTETAEIVSWMRDAAAAAGASIVCGTRVNSTLIESWPTDTLILQATGATSTAPAVPGADANLTLREALSLIASGGEVVGPIAVVDELEDEPVYAAVEHLCNIGFKVSLITRRTQIGNKLAYISRIGVYRRLDAIGVSIYPLQVPVRVDNGQLVTRNYFSGSEKVSATVRTILWAGTYTPSSPLATNGRESVLIGDAHAPRTIAAVILEGAATARRI